MKGRFRRSTATGNGADGGNRFSTQSARPLTGAAARAIEAAKARAASLQAVAAKPLHHPGKLSTSNRQQSGSGSSGHNDDGDYEDAYAAAYANVVDSYGQRSSKSSLSLDTNGTDGDDGEGGKPPFSPPTSPIPMEDDDNIKLRSPGGDNGSLEEFSLTAPANAERVAVVQPGDGQMSFPDISLGGGPDDRVDDSTLEDFGESEESEYEESIEEEEEEYDDMEEEEEDKENGGGTLFPDIFADDDDSSSEGLSAALPEPVDIKDAPKDFFPDVLADHTDEIYDDEEEEEHSGEEEEEEVMSAATKSASSISGAGDDEQDALSKDEAPEQGEKEKEHPAADTDQDSIKTNETDDTAVETPMPSPEKQPPVGADAAATADSIAVATATVDNESVDNTPADDQDNDAAEISSGVKKEEEDSNADVDDDSPDSPDSPPIKKVALIQDFKPVAVQQQQVEEDDIASADGKSEEGRQQDEVSDSSEEELDDEIDKVMDVIKSDSGVVAPKENFGDADFADDVDGAEGPQRDVNDTESPKEVPQQQKEEEEEVDDGPTPAALGYAVFATKDSDSDAVPAAAKAANDESKRQRNDMTELTYDSESEDDIAEAIGKDSSDNGDEDDTSSLRAGNASIADELTSNGGGSVASNEDADEEKEEEDGFDPTAIDSSDDGSSEDSAPLSAEMSDPVPMLRNDSTGAAGKISVDQGNSLNDAPSVDKEADESDYLPTTYMSPTPTRKNVKKDVSFNEGTTKPREDTMPSKVASSPSFNDDDKTMASETSRRTTQTHESSDTLPRSNLVLALVEPIDTRECGIGKGDIILSILSMPKKDGRKSKSAKSVGSSSSAGQSNADNDMAKWGGRNVKDAIWRMRKLHGRIEGEVSASLPVPGSIDTTSEESDFLKASRPVDAAKYGKYLQTRAAEALRKNDLAQALEGYEEIYTSYKIALETQRRSLGRQGNMPSSADKDFKYHPSLGAALYNIGIVHLLSASYDDALEKFEESKRIRGKKLGKDSAEYFASLTKQGIALYGLGRMSEAQVVFEECLANAPRETPSDKAQIGEVLNSYGCIQYASGQREAALLTFEQSLEINEALLSESLYGGADASSELIMTRIASTFNNIGQIGLKNRDYGAAANAFESAFKNQFLLFNSSSPFVLATMDKLAFTNVKKGDRNKALKMYNRMLEAQIEALGPHHIDCAQTLTKISLVHVEEKNFTSAQKSIDKVIEAEAKNENNPKVSGRFKSLSNAAKKSFKKKKVIARS